MTLVCIQVTNLKLSVDHLEKERDFYFAKLRDIEILCQIPEMEDLPVRVSRCLIYRSRDMDSIINMKQGFMLLVMPLFKCHADDSCNKKDTVC